MSTILRIFSWANSAAVDPPVRLTTIVALSDVEIIGIRRGGKGLQYIGFEFLDLFFLVAVCCSWPRGKKKDDSVSRKNPRLHRREEEKEVISSLKKGEVVVGSLEGYERSFSF